MSTIEINAIEDLREGDYVTLRWEKSEDDTVTLEGPMRFRAAVGGYVITDARFVSATREMPEYEPGTVYEITTPDGDTEKAWCVRHAPDGTGMGFVDEDCTVWQAGELTSIKPVIDDAVSWGDAEMWRKDSDAWQGRYNESNRIVEEQRAELAKAIQERDFWHQQYDDREEVTRTMRHGRRAQRERAEAAERERDEMQGDLQTQIQITRDVRAERDKALAEAERLEAEVKRLRERLGDLDVAVAGGVDLSIDPFELIGFARAEVERLLAARQVPTRKQIVGAMWPGAPESARAGMTHLEMVDRVVALFEQGDAE